MTFKSIFGQITILFLNFVTFRVYRFRVSHLTHETFKLCLQNTLNMSKTARVYFGVLQNRCIYVSTLLSEEEKAQLCQVIQLNTNVLAWTHAYMTRISSTHASHRLNVAPSAKPVRQKVRRFHPNRHLVIRTEVDNFLDNGFIRAVKYPEWLANMVVVPKKGNKWRVCVDYMDLNDACPKDSFPLPHIDQIVDTLAGHGMLSFLDAFSGYHQIPMHPPDAEKHLSSLPMDSTVIM